VGNHESALREYLDPTGKRSAVKVACCVWDGGTAVKPDLSLPLTRRYRVQTWRTFRMSPRKHDVQQVLRPSVGCPCDPSGYPAQLGQGPTKGSPQHNASTIRAVRVRIRLNSDDGMQWQTPRCATPTTNHRHAARSGNQQGRLPFRRASPLRTHPVLTRRGAYHVAWLGKPSRSNCSAGAPTVAKNSPASSFSRSTTSGCVCI